MDSLKINPKFKDLSEVLQWFIFNNINHSTSETNSTVPDSIEDLKSHLENGLIVSINAKWGAGKTTFLNYFSRLLQSQNNTISNYEFLGNTFEGHQYRKIPRESQTRDCIVINYNAWKQDYSKEPFLSLIGQIKNQVKEDTLSPDWIEKGAQIGSFLLKAASNIDIFGVHVDAHQITKDFTEISKTKIDNFLNEQEKFDSVIDSFKELLKNIKNSNTIKIILVDELDRCIPIFAVKLLERLKHFFNIENFVIVVAYDRSNLTKTLCKVYGEIDSHHYLSRLFNIELNLPELPSDFLLTQACNTPIAKIQSQLIHIYKIPAREVIKIIKYIEIISVTNKFMTCESTILIILKIYKPDKFFYLTNSAFKFHDLPTLESSLYKFFEIVEYNQNINELEYMKSEELLEEFLKLFFWLVIKNIGYNKFREKCKLYFNNQSADITGPYLIAYLPKSNFNEIIGKILAQEGQYSAEYLNHLIRIIESLHP